jgi:hypothetical protein
VAANAQAATTQSGTTLSSTQSITFQGEVEPTGPFGVENPLGPGSLTCQPGVPCETVAFSVAETGQATLTLFSDNPNNLLDVIVECGTMGVELPRTPVGGTDPVTGQAVLVFGVTAGETCTVFISVFIAEDVFAPVPFHGTITLSLGPAVETVPGHVSGGGQAMIAYSPFTSNAQMKKNGTGQGVVRYFTDSCKFHASKIMDVAVAGNMATITGFGRLNVGSGWSEETIPFTATAKDVNGGSMDEFQINQCGGNADGPTIANGNITVREAD